MKAMPVAATAIVAVALAAARPVSAAPPATALGGSLATFIEVTYDEQGNVVSQASGVGAPSDPADTVSTGLSGQGALEASEESAAGCKRVEGVKTQNTLLGFVAYRFHHWKYFCWSYPRITYVAGGHTFSDVDGNFYPRDVWPGGYWYTWRGDTHGGHTSYRQAQVENCIFKWGCLGSTFPYVQIWINGNGAWTYTTN